jgi:Undecaprenyl-phosphate glucose phosphotransferase
MFVLQVVQKMTNILLPDDNRRASIEDLRQHQFLSPPNRIERLVARIVVMEFLAVAGICFLTSVIYFETVLEAQPPIKEYAGAAVIIAFFVLSAASGFKQYVAIQTQSRDRYMSSGLGAVALAFSLLLSVLFVFKSTDWYSRGTFFCQCLSVSAIMLIARGTMHSYLHRAIQSGTVEARRAVLIGDTKTNGQILENLRKFGVRWVGALPFPHLQDHIVPSDNIRTFIETCRRHKPDDIMFLAAPADIPRIAFLVDALSELPTTVHIIPASVGELWGSTKISNFGGTITIQVLRPPLSAFDRSLKRLFDLCAAGLGLFILSPLLIMVSLAIKLDSRGPVLFRQNRHGYNNDLIPVLKFRTMTAVEDGETALTFTQAKDNDPRVTRLGQILRRTNIDELPQLINVLRGEMSLVGPRPHPIALNAMFQDRIAPFSRRHNVKPGLTGWAQINGLRGQTDTVEKMQRRIDYDLYYIDNWSFAFDLKIVMMTLFSKSAYTNAF